MNRVHHLAECLGKPDIKVLEEILATGMYSIEPINNSISRRVLSMLYSPGVGAACMSIKDDPNKIDELTLRGRSVAIVSDGSILGVSGSKIMPLMDWMIVQLKYYAGIDSFPFVIRNTANLETILSDLSTCYGTVLYLDPRPIQNVKIPEDLLLIRQADIHKISGSQKTDGEATARVLSELMKRKQKGLVRESQIKPLLGQNPIWIQKPKSYPFEINSGDLSAQALKMHSYYQGKIQISLNVKNLPAIKPYFTESNLTKLAQIQNITTASHRTSAIITDGTAILGYGDIGPRAGLPVMEGKSLLFKVLGDVDVVPVCINKRKTAKQAVQAILDLCSHFQAINLQDFKAPECFQIEETLSSKKILPVFHDDQHGTAIITLSAYINACKLGGLDPKKSKIVVNGAGAAGLTIAKLLYAHGVQSIVVCDSEGAIFEGRTKNMNGSKNELAKFTNKEKKRGKLQDVIKGSDVFVGVSVKGAFKQEWIKLMNKKPIIFAMANPDPEITYQSAMKGGCFIYGSGRSDQVNQINNSLVFPGIFRGIKEHSLPEITQQMKLKTAQAIAEMVGGSLSKQFIIPDSLNRDVSLQISDSLGKLK